MYSRHEFIAIARKLTSYIEIRNAMSPFRENPCSYMIADDQATLYRLQNTRWDGICELRTTGVARLYLEHFDNVWNQHARRRAPGAVTGSMGRGATAARKTPPTPV